MKVFLSYRRRDVGGYAGRLNDALVQRLGAKNVFQDVRAIAPGQDFADVIQRALDDCDAVKGPFTRSRGLTREDAFDEAPAPWRSASSTAWSDASSSCSGWAGWTPSPTVVIG